MVQKIANELVEQMIAEQLINVEQKEDYIYTYTILGEKLLTIGTICVMGVGFKNFINTLFFLIFFLVLRKRTGGFHANSFSKCYIGTIILYLVSISFCDRKRRSLGNNI